MKASFCTIDELKAEERYSCVGGPFGSDLTQRDYREDGVPVIRGANLPNDQEFLDDEFVFVSDQKADALAANTAYPGDLASATGANR
jgi:type I restriction enzyme, S subunit